MNRVGKHPVFRPVTKGLMEGTAALLSISSNPLSEVASPIMPPPEYARPFAKHGNYPARFESSLKLQALHIDLVVYRVLDHQLPASTSECDGWIISGSRHGAYAPLQWIALLDAFIKKICAEKRKLIGICFGHQIIAQSLGGVVSCSEKGWGIGVSHNKIINQRPWMQPLVNDVRLLVSHQDQVTTLSDSTTVLAASDFCPYYMLQYGEHVLSIQGHPEFSQSLLTDLMEIRRNIIPEECINRGIQSLKQKPDSELVCQWILNFLSC